MILVYQAAHALAAGDWVRQSAPSTYVKAKADTSGHAVCIGVVAEVLSANRFRLADFNDLVTLAATLVPGTIYYLSDTTAGAITATAPTIVVPCLIGSTVHTGEVIANGTGDAVGGGGAAIDSAIAAAVADEATARDTAIDTAVDDEETARDTAIGAAVAAEATARDTAIGAAVAASIQTTVRVGSGAPDNAVGINGDVYIRATGAFYVRAAGAYVLQFTAVVA